MSQKRNSVKTLREQKKDEAKTLKEKNLRREKLSCRQFEKIPKGQSSSGRARWEHRLQGRRDDKNHRSTFFRVTWLLHGMCVCVCPLTGCVFDL